MSMVEIEGIPVSGVSDQNSRWIPSISLSLTPTTRRNLRNILLPISRGDNVLIEGEAGTGKNAYLYYINYLRGVPTIRYSFNEDTIPDELIGSYRLSPGSTAFQWSDGPLSDAIRNGYTFVADEMNLASPELLKRFHSVYTGEGILLMEGDGKLIEPRSPFLFTATQNPAEGYEGRKTLPEEISKHFAHVYVDPYPLDEMAEILKELYPGINTEVIDSLVRINEEVERAVNDREIGAEDLEHYHFNLRTMKRVCHRLNSNKGEDSVLTHLNDVYAGPFRTGEDREFVEDVIRSNIRVDFKSGNQNQKEEDESRLTCNFSLDSLKSSPAAMEFFPPAESRLDTILAVGRACIAGEHLLLECQSDVEVEGLIRMLAYLNGRKLKTISLSSSMHTSDIIGGLRPLAEGEMSAAWIDGPLTSAIRKGEWILFTGLEAAGAELLEKLNMLLDDARALTLPPEAGATDPVFAPDNLRIFAIKYNRDRRSLPTISRAFRNRFQSITVFPVQDEFSLSQIAALRLGNHFEASSFLSSALARFHLRAREAGLERIIARDRKTPIRYGLAALERMIHNFKYSASGAGKKTMNYDDYYEMLFESAGIAYWNGLSLPEDRTVIQNILEEIINTDRESFLSEMEHFRSAGKKK